jgi:SAM-dependent methyltransferase
MNSGKLRRAPDGASLRRYYRERYAEPPFFRREAAAKLDLLLRHRSHIPSPRPARILDIGSGSGAGLPRLASSLGASDVVSVDLSTTALRRTPCGVAADAAMLPFPDGTFGTALFVDVLEHLADPVRALREARRVARTVVMLVPLDGAWFRRAVAAGTCLLYPRSACERLWGHLWRFDRHALCRVIRRAGLRPDHVAVGDVPAAAGRDVPRAYRAFHRVQTAAWRHLPSRLVECALGGKILAVCR